MENRLEEIRKRVLIRVLDNGEIQAMFWTACDDRRWLLIEVERLTAIADAAEANLQETIHTHAEFVSLRLEVERLREAMGGVLDGLDANSDLRCGLSEQDLIDSAHEFGQDLGRALAALATAKDRLAESKAEVKAQREELERLREVLKIYADKQNWWQTDPISIEWQGDLEEYPWEIARRALTGEFTGKIETVKLYPGKALTPEEISNDSDDLDDLNEWQLFDDE